MRPKPFKLFKNPGFILLFLFLLGSLAFHYFKNRLIPALLLTSFLYIVYASVKEHMDSLKKRDYIFLFSFSALSLAVFFTHVALFKRVEPLRDMTFFTFPYPMVAITASVILPEFLIFPYLSSLSIVFSIASSFSFWVFIYSFFGSLAAYKATYNSKKRSSLVKGGVVAGVVFAGIVVVYLMSKGAPNLEVYLKGMGLSLLAGTLGGLISVGLIPLSELIFGYTTNLRLLELGTLDHPLLRELSIKAPGTYYHSMLVSTLAEMAAEKVKANSILAKVGAYFHDIGKLKKPEYFVENQGLVNKHSKLSPHMSVLIIKSHVKDGVELAKAHKLGESIIDIIEQHHGTSLIAYFYKKALDAGEDVREEDFRYPGPKPQTKEAAIVMMADAVEAASRTLSEPTPGRIKGLVFNIINNLIRDGQLDECNLTFKDLRIIGDIFVKVLTGIHHKRIEYPKVSELRRKNESGGGGGRGKITPFPGRADKVGRIGKKESAGKG